MYRFYSLFLVNNPTYRSSKRDLIIIKLEQNDMRESPQIKNVEQWNLSNELCRRCGGDLVKYSVCAVCKQAMQHICVRCDSRSEMMLHQCHVHLEVYQTRHSMIENTYEIVA